MLRTVLGDLSVLVKNANQVSVEITHLERIPFNLYLILFACIFAESRIESEELRNAGDV